MIESFNISLGITISLLCIRTLHFSYKPGTTHITESCDDPNRFLPNLPNTTHLEASFRHRPFSMFNKPRHMSPSAGESGYTLEINSILAALLLYQLVDHEEHGDVLEKHFEVLE